jgi:malate synthase
MIAEVNKTYQTPIGMQVRGSYKADFEQILTTEALDFLMTLHERFNQKRKELLISRTERQTQFDNGILPDFLSETVGIRESDWTVNPVPECIQDRRVEITGPVDRKMIINALNSGAKVFMADFEDSTAPSWSNLIEGQINLRDAIVRNIDFTAPNGKAYQLNEKTAVLFVRPRGLHLLEKNILVHGEPMSGALVDFGLYFFHNAHELIRRGYGPFFYIPKLESHLEARLWNEVFKHAQSYLGIPNGTIKATVLIETLPASFELNEILYELKDHSAGLNCGRWDYIFSYIKKFRNHKSFTLPNRDQVTMTVPFMKAYSDLVIHTCHKRGAHAMGGMAAQIPIKNDPEANEAAINKVKMDKQREATACHDGTWVAHPGLVSTAMEIFDQHMPNANQVHEKRLDVSPDAEALIAVPTGTVTEEGLRKNINVGILYIESWLMGTGAAAIYHLMEDAATAEISRSQVWQWIHHPTQLPDGREVTAELYQSCKADEMNKIKSMVGEKRFSAGKFSAAASLFDDLVLADTLEEFLTIPAYNFLT